MSHKRTVLVSVFLGCLSLALPASYTSSDVGMNSPAQAVQLRDGKTYFVQPPTFVGASASSNRANAWSATYYFIIQTSKNAGEPLQTVAIAQTEGTDTVEFQLGETRVYAGDAGSDRTPVQIKTSLNSETRTLLITFEPPVPPGKAIEIGLSPARNPRSEGIYLFGVTAFPAGTNPHGQFLGFGRLHFYSSFR